LVEWTIIAEAPRKRNKCGTASLFLGEPHSPLKGYNVGMWTRRTFLVTMPVAAVPVLTAQDDVTQLQIEVKTPGGKPVERASVIVNFSEGRSIRKLGKKVITHWELRTNAVGIAKIPSVPQGKIQIQIVAKGYQTYGHIHEVNEPEKTLQITLKPPQKQYSSHE
jgi:hypothetical protein